MSRRLVALSLTLFALIAPVASAQCLDYSPTIGAPGTNGEVLCFAVFDDGSGPALYIGGRFTSIGGFPANGVAKWDGTHFTNLSSGVRFNSSTFPARVRAMCTYDDGTGPALYVGGWFEDAGGVPAMNIARWDGQWSALGSGLLVASLAFFEQDGVDSLATFDDGHGGGAQLYAGGFFQQAGGVGAANIARWNGATWSSVGTGLQLTCDPGSDVVAALQVHDDGSGPALYAGGEITPAISRWSGSSWTPVTAGLSSGGDCGAQQVRGLVSYSGGGSLAPGLYATGLFTAPSNGVARWNGASWQALGSGFSSGGQGRALALFDDGTGHGVALHATGQFSAAGGTAASNIARFDGSAWSSLGSGLTPAFRIGLALGKFAAASTGSGELWIGGNFDFAGSTPSENIATWKGCEGLGEIYCFGDGSLATACPCAPPDTVPNPSGASGAGCANSLNLAGATLRAFGATTPDTAKVVARIAAVYQGFAFLVKGNASTPTGIASHDGIRCASGALLRVGAHNAGSNGDPIGFWTYPNAVQTLPLSRATAQRFGEDAHYQLFYRNAQAGFCSPATANFTNAVRVGWH